MLDYVSRLQDKRQASHELEHCYRILLLYHMFLWIFLVFIKSEGDATSPTSLICCLLEYLDCVQLAAGKFKMHLIKETNSTV